MYYWRWLYFKPQGHSCRLINLSRTINTALHFPAIYFTPSNLWSLLFFSRKSTAESNSWPDISFMLLSVISTTLFLQIFFIWWNNVNGVVLMISWITYLNRSIRFIRFFSFSFDKTIYYQQVGSGNRPAI